MNRTTNPSNIDLSKTNGQQNKYKKDLRILIVADAAVETKGILVLRSTRRFRHLGRRMFTILANIEDPVAINGRITVAKRLNVLI